MDLQTTKHLQHIKSKIATIRTKYLKQYSTVGKLSMSVLV